MTRILFTAMTLLCIQANASMNRCYIRPKTSSAEIRMVFQDTPIHTTKINSCEILLKVHEFRQKYNILSILVDRKAKAAYIFEKVKL